MIPLDHPLLDRLRASELITRTGAVRRIMPTFIEADGPSLSLGALCAVERHRVSREQLSPVIAEVVGIGRDSITLAPFEDRPATFQGACVTALSETDAVPVGDGYLGRAVDALGQPIDGLPAIVPDAFAPLAGRDATPLARASPTDVLETGIRAIDGLLTLGIGQRIGIFAASGVGKTSLVWQLARQVKADRCIICLVGERGREVEALWSSGLAADIKSRTTLVAATSDRSAAMRARSCAFALTLAERWRDQGKHVLLLLDSVTRLAGAMREIGLAAGEPPTVRAYTPGVFAAVPKLVERCGAARSGGAITAVMTVLSETDEIDDPVSEMMRSLLDGHIVLSRGLAEQGHYPAIDIPRSLSRMSSQLALGSHHANARAASALLATYESSRAMIECGLYAAGSNAEVDRALARRPALRAYLQQGENEQVGFSVSVETLGSALAGVG